jgi:hypothetical protein
MRMTTLLIHALRVRVRRRLQRIVGVSAREAD